MSLRRLQRALDPEAVKRARKETKPTPCPICGRSLYTRSGICLEHERAWRHELRKSRVLLWARGWSRYVNSMLEAYAVRVREWEARKVA